MVCVDESLLVLLVAVPIGSVVFPRGRAVYVFGTSVMVFSPIHFDIGLTHWGCHDSVACSGLLRAHAGALPQLTILPIIRIGRRPRSQAVRPTRIPACRADVT